MEQNGILSKLNRQDGMTVPEGYFESFAERMSAALPHRPEAESPQTVILPPPTLWTRIRPYVYMAAMFAGIWCMLKLFSIGMPSGDTGNAIDSNPLLAEAIASDEFLRDFIIDDIDQWTVIDQLYDEGFDASALDISDLSDKDHSFIDPASTGTL